MRTAAIVVASAALALAGCSAATTASGGASGDVITRAEIEDTDVQSAFDVVRRLRPRFLRVRGSTTLVPGRTGPGITEPVVYMNGVRLGGVARLHAIEATRIMRIEYLDGSDATTRYGTGHVAGAIVVVTRVGGGAGAPPAARARAAGRPGNAARPPLAASGRLS